jgi:hypothetical protein
LEFLGVLFSLVLFTLFAIAAWRHVRGWRSNRFGPLVDVEDAPADASPMATIRRELDGLGGYWLDLPATDTAVGGDSTVDETRAAGPTSQVGEVDRSRGAQ